MVSEEIKKRIIEIENEKNELIEEAKKINKRLHYKNMELKALQPYLKENPNIKIGPYKKQLRNLEFKVSTQAYTPKIERELLKRIKTVKKELEEAMKVESVRRKAKLVEQDIEEATKRKEELDNKLAELREKLKNLREELKKEKIRKKTELKPNQEKTQKKKKEKKREEGKRKGPVEKYLSLKEIVEIKGKINPELEPESEDKQKEEQQEE